MNDRLGEDELERGGLWATKEGYVLHASRHCCRSRGQRTRVRDHSVPSYFDSERFELCPVALSAQRTRKL